MNVQSNIHPSIVSALAKALPELESAKKNKANPAFRSKYADLGAVIDALEPIKEHGLWYRQHIHESEAGVNVETIYIHESGEQLSAGALFMPASKKDAQGFGSALTYARRYSLQTAFGLATEDDDGNAAVKAAGQIRSGAVSPQPTISDDDAALLIQLIEASGIGSNRFCQTFEVKSVDQLPSNRLDEAKTRLNEALAKRAKAATNKEAENA